MKCALCQRETDAMSYALPCGHWLHLWCSVNGPPATVSTRSAKHPCPECGVETDHDPTDRRVIIRARKWKGVTGLSAEKVEESYQARLGPATKYGCLLIFQDPICLGIYCGAGPTMDQTTYYLQERSLFAIPKGFSFARGTGVIDYEGAGFFLYRGLKVKMENGNLIITGDR